MKRSRDDVLVIPENEGIGGFLCPICQGVAIGSRWALHAKYCPDCGQHIKISTPEFTKLKAQVLTMPEDMREDVCEHTVYIGLEGKFEKAIAGVYSGRLKAWEKDPERTAYGQMRMSEYLDELAKRGSHGKDHDDA